jgi:hypothetical protein
MAFLPAVRFIFCFLKKKAKGYRFHLERKFQKSISKINLPSSNFNLPFSNFKLQTLNFNLPSSN